MHDIAKVGRKHDIKEVADGYALNALIPQGAAIAATPSAVARVERARAENEAKRAAAEVLVAKEVSKVNGEEVVLERQANEQGHLFAAVHEQDIVDAIASIYKVVFEPRHIVIETPIKSVGEYRIHISVAGKKGAITIKVNART